MPSPALRTDLALLLVRAVIGVTFLLHGLDKLGDLAGTEAGFDGLGIPLPAVMAPFIAVLEVVGGAALIVGLVAPLAGLMLAGNMLVAGLTAHTGSGFFISGGGYELVLLLGVASLAIGVAGAGRLSLDARIGLEQRVARLRGGSPATA